MRARAVVVVLSMLCSVGLFAPPASAAGVTNGVMFLDWNEGIFEYAVAHTFPSARELYLVGTLTSACGVATGTGSALVEGNNVTFSYTWIGPTLTFSGGLTGSWTTICDTQTAEVSGWYA